MKYYFSYEFPVGTLCIEEEDNAIIRICTSSVPASAGRNNSLCTGSENTALEKETPLIREAARQLSEYFSSTRREFDLPLRLAGTDFQKKVWNALRTIPYGETRSYGEIAAQIGCPKAYRAVGGANNKNHILIVIPCHRVIGADGSLVGFGGGISMKEYLLKLEKQSFSHFNRPH